jgi:hypothetical protein
MVLLLYVILYITACEGVNLGVEIEEGADRETGVGFGVEIRITIRVSALELYGKCLSHCHFFHHKTHINLLKPTSHLMHQQFNILTA